MKAKSLLLNGIRSAVIALMAFAVPVQAEMFAGKEPERADGARVTIQNSNRTIDNSLIHTIPLEFLWQMGTPNKLAEFYWAANTPISFSIQNGLVSMKSLVDEKALPAHVLHMNRMSHYRLDIIVRGDRLMERGVYTVTVEWPGPIGSLDSAMCFGDLILDDDKETTTAVASAEGETKKVNRVEIAGGVTPLRYSVRCMVDGTGNSPLIKQMLATKVRFEIKSEKTGKIEPVTFANISNGLPE